MYFVSLALNVYSFVVLISVLGSWIGSRHEIFQFVDRLVEPVLAPLRRRLPPMAGFDWSPMILLVALRVLAALFH